MLRRFYEQSADVQKTKVTGLWEQDRSHLGITSAWRRLPAAMMTIVTAIVATFVPALMTTLVAAFMSAFVTTLFTEPSPVITGIHHFGAIHGRVRLGPQTCT